MVVCDVLATVVFARRVCACVVLAAVVFARRVCVPAAGFDH